MQLQRGVEGHGFPHTGARTGGLWRDLLGRVVAEYRRGFLRHRRVPGAARACCGGTDTGNDRAGDGTAVAVRRARAADQIAASSARATGNAPGQVGAGQESAGARHASEARAAKIGLSHSPTLTCFRSDRWPDRAPMLAVEPGSVPRPRRIRAAWRGLWITQTFVRIEPSPLREGGRQAKPLGSSRAACGGHAQHSVRVWSEVVAKRQRMLLAGNSFGTFPQLPIAGVSAPLFGHTLIRDERCRKALRHFPTAWCEGKSRWG
jgi:hypothetical protein